MHWHDREAEVMQALLHVRVQQGLLLGKASAIGFEMQDQTWLESTVQSALTTSEIEGEFLQPEQVRSSVARQMGIDMAGLVASDRHIDGLVQVLLDATTHAFAPLSEERLCGWQAALFPTGYSGMFKIQTGQWRTDSDGPMRVVSGGMGRERVHFEAPAANRLAAETSVFLAWLNAPATTDLVLKAALAHFWFITLHPFADGNGRLARAITDLLLAQADGQHRRFYSMSAAINAQKKEYYRILESCQRGDSDISEWMLWFLQVLMTTLQQADAQLDLLLSKARFWEKHRHLPLNPRQTRMVNRVFDGFEGHLTSSKWAKMEKCSTDTALRDLQDLVAKGVLKQAIGGGRSTHYTLVLE
jgi:Fic family protein